MDNILTNLLPERLHDFFQVLNVLNAMKTVNKLLLECSPNRIVHTTWDLSLGYSAMLPILFQLATHQLMPLLTDSFS